MGNRPYSSYVYIGVALLASNCSLTKVVVYHIPWYGRVALVSSSTYVYMGLSVSCRNFHALQLPYNAVSSPVTQPLLVVTNISGRGGGSFSIRHTNRQDR